MQNRPDPFAIPVILAWILLAGYYSYRSWFDVDGLEESMRRDIERLPSWYPLRNYSLNNLGTSKWLWQIRIFSTMGTIIGMMSVLLIAYLLVR